MSRAVTIERIERAIDTVAPGLHKNKRKGTWYFARRIPKEFGELDRRGIVQQSTKIRIADDLDGIIAGEVAKQLNAALESYWQQLAHGSDVANALSDYETARKAAFHVAQKRSPSDAVALYRHFDRGGNLIYVGIAANPFRRFEAHSSTSAWYKKVAHIEIRWFPTRKLAEVAERRAIFDEKPSFNRERYWSQGAAA